MNEESEAWTQSRRRALEAEVSDISDERKELIERGWNEHTTFDIGGAPFEIQGVAHVKETLERKGKELETAIARSSIVVVENAPELLGNYSKSNFLAGERFLAHDPYIKKDQYGAAEGNMFRPDADRESKISDYIFWDGITALAAKHRKDICVVDPMSHSFEGEMIHNSLNAALKAGKVTAATAGLVLTGVISASEVVDLLKGNQELALLSRRSIIQGLGAVLAGGTVGSMIAEKRPETVREMTTVDVGTRTGSTLGALIYNVEDYRNVLGGEVAHVLSKLPISGSRLYIYGGAHVKPMAHYAQSASERQAKYAAYQPFRALIPPVMLQFRYDTPKGKKTGEWNVLKRFPL